MRANGEVISEVPIVVFGYNRPEFLRERLKEISKSKSTRVIVSLDWHSDLQNEAFAKIERDYAGNWPENSVLSFIFHEKNLGLAKHITDTVTEVLNEFPAVIVVEDDISVTSETINSLINALNTKNFSEKYASVGGYSPIALPRILERLNTFRESRYFVCWGWGTTRESWDSYKLDLSQISIEDSLSESKIWNSLSKRQQRTWLGRFRKLQHSPIHTWDIQFQYMMFAKDQLSLLPVGRILENKGFDDPRSSHTQSRRPRWMGPLKYSEGEVRISTKNRLLRVLMETIESLTVIGDSRGSLRNILRRGNK